MRTANRYGYVHNNACDSNDLYTGIAERDSKRGFDVCPT